MPRFVGHVDARIARSPPDLRDRAAFADHAKASGTPPGERADECA
jgi:hypothetical protein